MIYLIIGAPRTGKTTLAKKLGKKLNIPYVFGDYLKSIASQFCPKTADDTKVSNMKYRNDYLYSHFTAQENMDRYRKEAKQSYRAIQTFARYALHEQEDYIIEGWQMEPESISKDFGEHIGKDLQVVCLYQENKDDMLKGFHKSTERHDWILEHSSNTTTLERIADMLLLYSKFFKEESEKYGFGCFETSGSLSEKLAMIMGEIS